MEKRGKYIRTEKHLTNLKNWASNRKGKKHSEATKIKIGKSNSVSRPNMRGEKNPFYGKKHSEQTKEINKIAHLNKRQSEELKIKRGLYQKGENHWNWIKDRTLIKQNEKKHLCTRYRNWMFDVKERDNWKCKINNSDCSGRLESHHILDWKNYPELRYDINNGITLCHAHHPRGRIKEAELSPYFQELVAEVKKL